MPKLLLAGNIYVIILKRLIKSDEGDASAVGGVIKIFFAGAKSPRRRHRLMNEELKNKSLPRLGGIHFHAILDLVMLERL